MGKRRIAARIDKGRQKAGKESRQYRIIEKKEEYMWTIEDARAYFMNDRFAMDTTGIEILDVKEKYAKCSFAVDERHQNATGHVMGGAIFTLADFVFAVAGEEYGLWLCFSISWILLTASFPMSSASITH